MIGAGRGADVDKEVSTYKQGCQKGEGGGHAQIASTIGGGGASKYRVPKRGEIGGGVIRSWMKETAREWEGGGGGDEDKEVQIWRGAKKEGEG